MTSLGPGSGSYDPGLLLVLSQPQPDHVDEFNRWYDDEHVPARRDRPGWLTARRYVTVDRPDSFLAYYDLADLGVLEDPSYRELRSARSEREQRVLRDLLRLDRRIYRASHPGARAGLQPRTGTAGLRDDGPASVCGQLLLCVWWEPRPESLEVFHRWYEEEHLPLLAQVPGWRRSRRFTLVSGDGPAYLAMHDLDHSDVFSHPTYRRAISTPLREAAVGTARAHERNLFRLLRRSDRSRGDGTQTGLNEVAP